jgi:hypothetical protein
MPVLTKGAAVIFGVDYSSGRPSTSALKAAGVQFVCRYIGSTAQDATRSAKWLTPGEAKARHADGFDVVVVFEKAAQRAEGGATAGTEDAHTAVAELAFCGLPADQPVYFAVDYDAAVGPHVTAYFQAINKVLGVGRTGAYGGVNVIKALFDKKLITYGWQTAAWSDGKWDPRAQLQQYSNDHTIAGAAVDYDRALSVDFGQWPAKTVPLPAKPKPWPGRYLRVTSPLMHGADVTWVQEHLNSHGANPKLKVDSEYGPKTRDAVRVFQHAHKLTADGIVGKLTWAALGKS